MMQHPWKFSYFINTGTCIDLIVCDKIYFFLCLLSFSVRFFHILSYFKQQKNPGNLTVPGYLTLGHNVPCGTQYILISDYSMIVATRPDPTVRPPSRIAKVRPWLIAIGWISSIVISMLSPGMHISVPSGRLQTPVTSVVLK